MARVVRTVTVERTTSDGQTLTQEVQEQKWNNRHKPWQKAGWTLAKKQAAPAEAKKVGKEKEVEL